MKYLPENKILRGFVSGIALSVLASVGVLSAVMVSNAQGSQAEQNIWSGLWSGANLSFGSAQSTTSSSPNDIWRQPDEPQPEASTPASPGSQSQLSSSNRYVALGDSVAAGLGLPYLESASSQDRRCGRSSQAYAFEAGRILNRPTELYACSGASAGDLYTRQWISNQNADIQINQAFASGTPGLISITVGANDLNWSRLIQRCYTGTCGTAAQTANLQDDLEDMQRYLGRAMTRIEQRSNGAAPLVIITGYYNPISAQCSTLLPDRITSAEIDWVSRSANSLNQSLQQVAANYSFARFAAIDFSGHDICSSDPWVQTLTDRAPIHPTAEGQVAIARAIAQVAGANSR